MQNGSRTVRLMLALVVGSSLSTAGPLAQGCADVCATFSLVKTDLTVDEPVFVNLTVANELDVPVAIDLGPSSYGNLRATLVRPDGRTETGGKPAGFRPPGKALLGPRSPYSALILLNRWFQFDQPGLYALDIELQAPLRTERGSALPYAVQGHVAINIGPRDALRLQRMCGDLADLAAHASSRVVALESADVLSYIVDPVAVPFLAGLLQPNMWFEQQAVRGLGRIADGPSVEVLTANLSSPSEDARVLARGALTTIRRTTKDPEIRQRIDDVLR